MAEPNIDIVIDCADPETLAEFWAEALGYTKAGMFDPYYVLLAPTRNTHPSSCNASRSRRRPRLASTSTCASSTSRPRPNDSNNSVLDASTSAKDPTPAGSRWPTRKATSSASAPESRCRLLSNSGIQHRHRAICRSSNRPSGGDGDRTHYLLHAMQALYQLSYAPVGGPRYQPGRAPSAGSLARYGR